ncbi:MAG: preprotein translocase subunit SecG [Acidobacteria bacterium]|nr:preprotein translocase subunit SecG [Acidobacteriota bacterium]
MVAFLVAVHIIISILLILIVIMQPGKGADLAGAFGGGGSQTAFGARGAATLLHKLTVAFFVLFILTSVALAVLQARPRASVMENQPPVTQTQPAAVEPDASETPAVPVEAPPVDPADEQ